MSSLLKPELYAKAKILLESLRRRYPEVLNGRKELGTVTKSLPIVNKHITVENRCEVKHLPMREEKGCIKPSVVHRVDPEERGHVSVVELQQVGPAKADTAGPIVTLRPDGKRCAPPKEIVVFAPRSVVPLKQIVSKPLSDDDKTNLTHALDLILTIFCDYGFDRAGYKMSSNTQVWFSECSLVGGGWMKYVKWRIATFCAIGWEQESLPPVPCAGLRSGSFLLGGRAVKFQKLLRNNKEKWFSFLQSIGVGGKKGFNRPGPNLVQKGCVDTFTELTNAGIDACIACPQTFPERTSGSLVDVGGLAYFNLKVDNESIDVAKLKEQLCRTVKELFGSGQRLLWLQELQKPCVPSTSSVYNNSRSKLGGFGEVCSVLNDDVQLPLVFKMSWLQMDPSSFDNEMRVDVEDRFLPRYLLDESQLDEDFSRVVAKLKSHYRQNSDNCAEIVGLSEALKVRCITKGNAILNYLLKPLQKVMHSTLRSHPVFSLIGEPASESHIQDVIDRMEKLDVFMPKQFISGDYSNATNALRGWVSETIADEVSNCLSLDEDYREFFMTNLCRNKIVLKDGDRRLEAEQVEGQLMGSITSFPVLCIANAALIRYAYELRLGRRLALRDVPLKVNGDDCLFIGDQNLKDIWSIIGSRMGLNESVGKTFIHPYMAQINSTGYVNYLSGVRRIGYINYGLLKGLKRSSVGNNDAVNADPFELASCARELIRLSDPSQATFLAKKFFELHEPSLRRYGVSYFLPQWAGGLGLPLFDGCVNDRDLAVRCLRLKVMYSSTEQLELKSTKEVEWLTFRIVNEKLRSLDLQETNVDDPSPCLSADGSLMYWAFRQYGRECHNDGGNVSAARLNARIDVCHAMYRKSSIPFTFEKYFGFDVDPDSSIREISIERALEDPRVVTKVLVHRSLEGMLKRATVAAIAF